jgi:hypothetical protein
MYTSHEVAELHGLHILQILYLCVQNVFQLASMFFNWPAGQQARFDGV